MTPFLSLVAHDLYIKKQGDLSHTVVVFPGKRATLFFNQHLLAESGGQPLFAPTYMTLDELFGSLTDLRTEDPIRLVCLLHRYFNRATQRNESIDMFYNWGELLLADFDDIDKNLAPAASLFANLNDYKALASPDDYLTDEQREVLEKFFGGFHSAEGKSVIRENFLRIWQVMGSIYEDFRKGLKAEGRGYEGMIFRDAVEHFDASRLTADTYVFVGFNVLSAVEGRLFDLVRESGKAMFYWDYDHYYMNEPKDDGETVNEAGTFLRQNLRRYGNELRESDFPEDENPFDNFRHLKELHLVAAATDSAQADYAHDWLRQNLTPIEKETAVVLCDENLLVHVLHAFPNDDVKGVNVTMGLPMTETVVYHFLTEQMEGDDKEESPLGWLQRISDAINEKGLEVKKKRLENNLQEEEEALYRAHLAVTSLIRLVSEGTLDAGLGLLKRLFGRLLRGIAVPFHGEPATGVQVMGVLETRNLDFRHLLLLSTNEGLLPKPSSEVSFIPYSLRKAFGLTTIERQTAVYAYYFYRMISRAERVTLVYNNGTDGMQQKMPSRFITQLMVEFGGEVHHHVVQATEQFAGKEDAIVVEQTDETRRKLLDYFSRRRLSPSALNNYLTCRLKFYLSYIEGLRYEEENLDEITTAQFGTLLHRSAELAYIKLTEAGPIVRRSDLEDLAKNDEALQRMARQAFREEYWKTESDEGITYSGIHIINFKVICTYLKQLLLLDAEHAPFEYIQGEQELREPFNIECGGTIYNILLGGTIDRLDTKDGITRIIDYKTGRKHDSISSVERLFNQGKRENEKHIFQTFFYAWLLCRKNPSRVSPALLYVMHTASKDYDPTIKLNNTPVTDFAAEVFEEFDQGMKALLDEIFNSDVPYTQVEDENACMYCDFCAICGRKPKDFTS